MKNYTSTVPVERTISRIESILAKAGAQSIAKSYKDGAVVSMSFILPIPGRGSYYEFLKLGGFKALPEGKKED